MEYGKGHYFETPSTVTVVSLLLYCWPCVGLVLIVLVFIAYILLCYILCHSTCCLSVHFQDLHIVVAYLTPFIILQGIFPVYYHIVYLYVINFPQSLYLYYLGDTYSAVNYYAPHCINYVNVVICFYFGNLHVVN